MNFQAKNVIVDSLSVSYFEMMDELIIDFRLKGFSESFGFNCYRSEDGGWYPHMNLDNAFLWKNSDESIGDDFEGQLQVVLRVLYLIGNAY